MFAVLLLAAAAAAGAAARGYSQQPEDIHAWPKYGVSFLNGLPLLNHTAQRWLQDGLRGGENEFLGLQWTTDPQPAPQSPKAIDAGDSELAMDTPQPADVDPSNPSNPSATPSPKLQHMRLDPSNEFLCLISPPPKIPPYFDDTLQPPAPTRTWGLLQPLQDTCLYVCPYFKSHALNPDNLYNANVSIDKAGLPMPTVITNTSASFAKRNPNYPSVRLISISFDSNGT